MNQTRRARSLLADPRRELASVLTVMALVLAVMGMHVLCSAHLDERARAAATVDNVAAQHAVQDTTTQVTVGSHTAAAGIAPGPLGDDPHCSGHRTVTAQSDPVLLPPQGPAVVPDLAAQWLVPDMPHHGPRTSSGVAAVAAPSLHALGISRT
jgi:hypothetical protein